MALLGYALLSLLAIAAVLYGVAWVLLADLNAADRDISADDAEREGIDQP